MTDIETLESLGFSKEEIEEKVIERLCDRFTHDIHSDEEGRPVWIESQLSKELGKKVKGAIDAKIDAISQEHILPKVSSIVDEIVLQETNEWGEKKGESLTFIEYLTQRANAYISEKVDHRGKSKAEEGYGWNGSTTRVAYLIHEHLQYSIDKAVKNALVDINKKIGEGLADTVKMKVEEACSKLAKRF